MKIEDLLDQIPPELDYTFNVQRMGYRYFCHLKITNGSKTEFNGTSNELVVALQLLSANLKTFLSARHKSAKSPA